MSDPVPALLDEIQFGVFTADLRAHELRKHGTRVKLQERPFQLLAILLERPGAVVTRDELRSRLWPDGTFVDFDHSISSAVRKLRDALGDSASTPRYVETVGRRGYRFTCPVTRNPSTHVLSIASAVQQQRGQRQNADSVQSSVADYGSQLLSPRHGKLFRRWWVAAALALLAFVIAAGVSYSHRGISLSETDTAVLANIENRTGDSAFDGTLKEALRLKLHESPYLNLVPETELRTAMTDLGQGQFADVSSGAIDSVCRRLGARVVLSGTVTRETTESYRVRLNATGCMEGKYVAREEVRATSRGDVLPALGRAADGLRRKLGEPAATLQQFRTPMVQASTNSLAALKMFSDAEEKRAQGQDYETIPLFKMATDLDPTFALAYARLGIIYSNAQEFETSRQFFSKAFELREHATEQERLYITAHHYAGTGEVDKLLQVYELWRQLYPRDLIPPNNLVSVYLTLGNLEKAVDAAREAVRLGPNNAFPYMGLVRAYQKTGRFAEAKRAYDEVVARKLDGIVVHLERYVIAFAEHDIAEMQRQLDWAHGKAQEGELLNEAAWGAMANGQTRRARTLFSEAERAGLKNGLPQFAVSGWLDYAQFCSELGLRAEARSSLNKVLLSASTSPEFRATAAIVFANIGDLRSADELASTAARQSRSDIVMNAIRLPTARAAADLQRRAPEVALRELHIVEPYDLSWITELTPIYFRGLAYLQLRRPTEAAEQFRKLLDHWASRPESLYIVLAHLGMARAHALGGRPSDARGEYEQVFSQWKDADPDIPILRQAKAEYAKLQ